MYDQSLPQPIQSRFVHPANRASDFILIGGVQITQSDYRSLMQASLCKCGVSQIEKLTPPLLNQVKLRADPENQKILIWPGHLSDDQGRSQFRRATANL